MGAIVRLHDAQAGHRPALGEIPDPTLLVTEAFRRFLALAGATDQEVAQLINRATESDRVRPVHVRRWADGHNSPPVDYFLIALWLAGPAGLDVLSDLLDLTGGQAAQPI